MIWQFKTLGIQKFAIQDLAIQDLAIRSGNSRFGLPNIENSKFGNSRYGPLHIENSRFGMACQILVLKVQDLTCKILKVQDIVVIKFLSFREFIFVTSRHQNNNHFRETLCFMVHLCCILDDPSVTVSELFLSGVGGTQLRRHLAHKLKASQEMSVQDPALLWSTFFNQAVYTLMDLMYPC